jgi:hypothetical protein
MVYQGQKSKGTQLFTEFPNTDSREMHCIMECMSICTACSKKCIEEGHKKTALICADCAKICDLAIQFKSCESEFQTQVLDLCAQICKKCADECNKMKAQHCQECAEACRRCVEACSSVYSYH